MVSEPPVPIGTVLDPVATQPFLFTLTLNTTLPLGAAVKVMLSVPAPPVIVPPVMVHVYEAPATMDVEAVLPVELAQTFAGALMTAAGGAVIVTELLPVLTQPLLVTVTVRPTVPDAPAVNVMAFVVAPAVIVPLAMDQL